VDSGALFDLSLRTDGPLPYRQYRPPIQGSPAMEGDTVSMVHHSRWRKFRKLVSFSDVRMTRLYPHELVSCANSWHHRP